MRPGQATRPQHHHKLASASLNKISRPPSTAPPRLKRYVFPAQRLGGLYPVRWSFLGRYPNPGAAGRESGAMSSRRSLRWRLMRSLSCGLAGVGRRSRRQPLCSLFLMIVVLGGASLTITTNLDKSVFAPQPGMFNPELQFKAMDNGDQNQENNNNDNDANKQEHPAPVQAGKGVPDAKPKVPAPAPTPAPAPKPAGQPTAKPKSTTKKPGSTKKVQFLDEAWEDKLREIDEADERKAAAKTAPPAVQLNTPAPANKKGQTGADPPPNNGLKAGPAQRKPAAVAEEPVKMVKKPPPPDPPLPKPNSSKNVTIPHVFHLLWTSYNVPWIVAPWIKSWVEQNPGWEVWFWRPSDVQRLVNQTFKDSQVLYNIFPEGAFKAEIMKYFILHAYGGIVLNLDLEDFRPLEGIVVQHACVMSEEPPELSHFVHKSKKVLASSAMFGARHKHPFLEALLKELPAAYRHTNSKMPSAIMFFNQVFEKYNHYQRPQEDAVVLFESRHFQPTFDNRLLPIFKRKCSQGPNMLNDQQQEVCKTRLSEAKPNTLPRGAYGTRHWLRLWDTHPGKEPAYLKSTVSIKVVLPKVKAFGYIPQSS